MKARAGETKRAKQSWDCIQIKEDDMRKQFNILADRATSVQLIPPPVMGQSVSAQAVHFRFYGQNHFCSRI